MCDILHPSEKMDSVRPTSLSELRKLKDSSPNHENSPERSDKPNGELDLRLCGSNLGNTYPKLFPELTNEENIEKSEDSKQEVGHKVGSNTNDSTDLGEAFSELSDSEDKTSCAPVADNPADNEDSQLCSLKKQQNLLLDGLNLSDFGSSAASLHYYQTLAAVARNNQQSAGDPYMNLMSSGNPPTRPLGFPGGMTMPSFAGLPPAAAAAFMSSLTQQRDFMTQQHEQLLLAQQQFLAREAVLRNNVPNVPKSLSECFGNVSSTPISTVETSNGNNNNTIYQTNAKPSKNDSETSNQDRNMDGEKARLLDEDDNDDAFDGLDEDMEDMGSIGEDKPNDDKEGSHQWTFEEQFKQLYELSSEPKRKEFLDDLFCFMQKRGTPVNRIPIMAKQVLDLYELFRLVASKGGLVEVINKKLWREITKGLNLPSSITSAAFTLRTQYMKYLYPYECEKLKLSTPGELQAAIDGNRREARRPSYSFEYPMMLNNGPPPSQVCPPSASGQAGLSQVSQHIPPPNMPIGALFAAHCQQQAVGFHGLPGWNPNTLLCSVAGPNTQLSPMLRQQSMSKDRGRNGQFSETESSNYHNSPIPETSPDIKDSALQSPHLPPPCAHPGNLYATHHGIPLKSNQSPLGAGSQHNFSNQNLTSVSISLNSDPQHNSSHGESENACTPPSSSKKRRLSGGTSQNPRSNATSTPLQDETNKLNDATKLTTNSGLFPLPPQQGAGFKLNSANPLNFNYTQQQNAAAALSSMGGFFTNPFSAIPLPNNHLRMTTKPGSQLGMPDNALVVSMEVNNTIYQGVLFAQPKRY